MNLKAGKGLQHTTRSGEKVRRALPLSSAWKVKPSWGERARGGAFLWFPFESLRGSTQGTGGWFSVMPCS